MEMTMSKEVLQAKITKLESKRKKLCEKLTQLPKRAEVEKGESKVVVNPQLNARKSSRKVRRKLVNLRSKLKQTAS